MTRRMITAIANPHTDVLGHCTGRMVLDHLRGAEQPREPRQRGRINQ